MAFEFKDCRTGKAFTLNEEWHESGARRLIEMGSESVVYGAIVGTQWKITDSDRLQRENLKVIASLPDTDAWPFLTRGLFYFNEAPPPYGRYKSHLISFGGTFKGIEWDWEEWLTKFEALLTRMYWDTVYLHAHTVTYGDWDGIYESENHERFYECDPPQPVKSWIFTGGSRDYWTNTTNPGQNI